jgi:alpha-glucuronidase
MKKTFCILYFLFIAFLLRADDGYRLWLRYDKINDPALLQQYKTQIVALDFPVSSPILRAAKKELFIGLEGLLAKKIPEEENLVDGTVIVGSLSSSFFQQFFKYDDINLGKDGFIIQTTKYKNKKVIIIVGSNDAGVLYGVFHFLRLMQTHQSIQHINIVSIPKIQNRILDHWDNLNRTIERGYAGISIWNWHLLPDYIDKRYIDYARANASIGINGSVLTNVNANALVLTKQYLIKVKALADVFRPYGIKVYLTAKFSAPVEIGGLKTADPLDPEVQNWWKKKCD